MAELGRNGNRTEGWQSVERELTEAAGRVRERDTAEAVARRADEQVAAIEAQLERA